MKQKHYFSRGVACRWLSALSLCILASGCTDSFDPESFSSGVTNTTLNAPEVSARSNADGTKTIVEWPVVMGAGGVKLSLYNVDDAANPIPIVVDTIIDGSTAELPRTEDTYYKLTIQALGNEKYSNTESEVKEFSFSSWVPKINETPLEPGTDIAQWFKDNAELVAAQTEEFSVELAGNGEYTMSDVVNLGQVPFVLYSKDKENKALIKMGAYSGFSIETGIKLKYVDFDCTEMTADTASIILLPKEPVKEKFAATSNPSWNIDGTTPVVLQNVSVKNLQTHLIWTSNVCWTVNTILLDNCVMGLDQVVMKSNGGNMIDMSYGFVYNLKLRNSTFYSTTSLSENGAFLVVMSQRPQQYLNGTFPTCQFEYLNNTFVNCNKGKSGDSKYMFSYGRLKGQKVCTTIVKNNIFVDCSSNRVARGAILQGQNGGMITEFANNSYWYDGAQTDAAVDWNKGDRVTGDPALEQTEHGWYKVNGAEVKAAGCGDPRGLE